MEGSHQSESIVICTLVLFVELFERKLYGSELLKFDSAMMF